MRKEEWRSFLADERASSVRPNVLEGLCFALSAAAGQRQCLLPPAGRWPVGGSPAGRCLTCAHCPPSSPTLSLVSPPVSSVSEMKFMLEALNHGGREGAPFTANSPPPRRRPIVQCKDRERERKSPFSFRPFLFPFSGVSDHLLLPLPPQSPCLSAQSRFASRIPESPDPRRESGSWTNARSRPPDSRPISVFLSPAAKLVSLGNEKKRKHGTPIRSENGF